MKTKKYCIKYNILWGIRGRRPQQEKILSVKEAMIRLTIAPVISSAGSKDVVNASQMINITKKV
jgi:hypothetical protein